MGTSVQNGSALIMVKVEQNSQFKDERYYVVFVRILCVCKVLPWPAALLRLCRGKSGNVLCTTRLPFGHTKELHLSG